MRTWSEPLGGPTPETEDWEKSKTKQIKKQNKTNKPRQKLAVKPFSARCTVWRIFRYILTTLKMC